MLAVSCLQFFLTVSNLQFIIRPSKNRDATQLRKVQLLLYGSVIDDAKVLIV